MSLLVGPWPFAKENSTLIAILLFLDSRDFGLVASIYEAGALLYPVIDSRA